jgi:lipase
VPPPDLHIVPSQIAVWEWPALHPTANAPALLFAHATGFHGRMWDHIVRLFPNRRCLALEFRGHGRSHKPAPPIPWLSFAEDILSAARYFNLQGVIGVGHSLGGHALTAAAAARPQTFSRLVLVDPVILRRERYGAPPMDAAFIGRRRNRFASPSEMFERFRPRLPFSAWPEEVLRSYCDYALLPESGSFVLACPPATEADIYTHSNAPESNIYPLLPTILLPVTILRAGRPAVPGLFNPAASPTAPDLASNFPNARDILLPHNSHFIPMESPETIAHAIRTADH